MPKRKTKKKPVIGGGMAFVRPKFKSKKPFPGSVQAIKKKKAATRKATIKRNISRIPRVVN